MSKKGYTTYPTTPCVWQGTIPEGADKMRYDVTVLKSVRDFIHAMSHGVFQLDDINFSRSGVDNQFLLLLEIKAQKPMSPEFWGKVIDDVRAELKDKKPVIFLKSTVMEEVTQ